VSAQPICCSDLSIRVGHQYIIRTGQGYFFVTLDRDGRKLVPFCHCPWCGTALQEKSEQPHAVAINAF